MLKIMDRPLIQRGAVVDLTSAASDYELDLGETAKITYTTSDATKPLRIKTVEGLYEITMIGDLNGTGSNGLVSLRANNALTSAGDWDYTMFNNQIGTGDAGTGANPAGWASGTSATAAYIAERNIVFASIQVSTVTIAKTIKSEGLGKSATPQYGPFLYANFWQDFSTAWTSLGTMSFAGSQAGTLYVNRLL